MLDIACGSGVVAREAKTRFPTATVMGLDMNPQMIEVAQERAREDGLDIAWHVGMADQLPFDDGAFDLVTIQQGFQFFPDQAAALAEIRRVLRPGGTFALNIWAAHDQQGINQYFSESVERMTGSASMHTPYAMSDMNEIRALLSSAGVTVDSIELVEIECSHSPVENFVELMLQSVSAGVPAMHGHGDEERAELASGHRAGYERRAGPVHGRKFDRHTLAVEHCAGTRVVTEPVRLET